MKRQVQSAIDQHLALQFLQADRPLTIEYVGPDNKPLRSGMSTYTATSDLEPDCRSDLERLRLSFPEIEGVRAVTGASLRADMRGRGFGREMYEHALVHAAEQGQAMVPDRCTGGGTSEAAMRVWESLKRNYPHVGNVVWGGK